MAKRSADRRGFLKQGGSAGVLALFGAAPLAAQDGEVPAGVDVEALASGERLLDLTFTDAEREAMRAQVAEHVAWYRELRAAGLRNDEPPAERFDPRLPGMDLPTAREVHLATAAVGDLPGDAEDIAFASIAQLSHWLRTRQISSVDLTGLYLDRLRRFGPRLECVITLTEELAMRQARRADQEIARGGWRGPLHGLPWGAKDLLDTRGIRTTWGAAPFRDQVPDRDAAVVARLAEAGAVLVAKLSLGALAYGDVWFDGRTRNPFHPAQGSSGSSAGSAAATAAGLVTFSIGSETWGSIASPSARCGATGLRPTFGRVSRAGAMALCWSLDKIGPICRSAADCAQVLAAIDGADPRDPTTQGVPLSIDLSRAVRGMRVGYLAAEYTERGASDDDRATLDALRALGVELLPKAVPEIDAVGLIGFLIAVESAAAFDELTRSDRDDLMVRQDALAWPNLFRAARFIPAVEYLQASRLRRRAMLAAQALFADVDVIIAPQRQGALHALTNITGHPAITVRQSFRDDGTPRATTLWGGVYQDGRLLSLAHALEERLDVRDRRPLLTGL